MHDPVSVHYFLIGDLFFYVPACQLIVYNYNSFVFTMAALLCALLNLYSFFVSRSCTEKLCLKTTKNIVHLSTWLANTPSEALFITPPTCSQWAANTLYVYAAVVTTHCFRQNHAEGYYPPITVASKHGHCSTVHKTADKCSHCTGNTLYLYAAVVPTHCLKPDPAEECCE